jgi:c-di-GMP-binding flagellar brake protein YcgR
MELHHLRRFPRISFNEPVEYTLDDTTQRARALTLGGGGLFLGISEQIPPGTELTVRFRPAKHLPTVEARARVCYQSADEGVGIEFTEIKPEDRQRILRLILHRIPEKRRFPRAPLAVQVEHEAGMLIGFSRDISVGGMFIETKEPPPTGSHLKLRFYLDEGGPIVLATAEVVYAVAKLGIGVHFIEISPADRSRIDVYVTKGEMSR